MSASQERNECLQIAAECVSSDRNQTYGEPEDNFACIASMWNAYLGQDLVKPHDVAAMMALVKLARIRTSPGKLDHWIDLAGYAACGYETRR